MNFYPMIYIGEHQSADSLLPRFGLDAATLKFWLAEAKVNGQSAIFCEGVQVVHSADEMCLVLDPREDGSFGAWAAVLDGHTDDANEVAVALETMHLQCGWALAVVRAPHKLRSCSDLRNGELSFPGGSKVH